MVVLPLEDPGNLEQLVSSSVRRNHECFMRGLQTLLLRQRLESAVINVKGT